MFSNSKQDLTNRIENENECETGLVLDGVHGTKISYAKNWEAQRKRRKINPTSTHRTLRQHTYWILINLCDQSNATYATVWRSGAYRTVCARKIADHERVLAHTFNWNDSTTSILFAYVPKSLPLLPFLNETYRQTSLIQHVFPAETPKRACSLSRLALTHTYVPDSW